MGMANSTCWMDNHMKDNLTKEGNRVEVGINGIAEIIILDNFTMIKDKG